MEAQEPDLIVPCHVSGGVATVIDASNASLVSFKKNYQVMTMISAREGYTRMPGDTPGVLVRRSSLSWFSP